MNLLEETKDDIRISGHTPEQIIFIGSASSGHRCTWSEFCLLANREYNPRYGAKEVASDLIIVFDDGSSMWRHEYDGPECWHYSTPFVKPEVSHFISTLISGGMWEDLKTMNPITKES